MSLRCQIDTLDFDGHIYMIYGIYDFSDKLIQDGNGDISFNEFVWLMTKWVSDDDDDGGDDGDDQVSDDEDDQTMWVPIIGNGFGNKGIHLKSFL